MEPLAGAALGFPASAAWKDAGVGGEGGWKRLGKKGNGGRAERESKEESKMCSY